MDSFKYDFDKEYEDVVSEISNKFKYSSELQGIIAKITKAVVEGKSYEDRQIFYRMLRTTPIVILPEGINITQDELSDKIFGGEVNPHIKSKEFDRGEYDKQEAAGSFVTSPVLDENLNLTGVKKYLFVRSFDTTRELTDKEQQYYDMFHTGINVSHLMHELGHAYVAEQNPYTMEDNILTMRIGACEMKSKFTPLGNGQYESEPISTTGMYIEEGLNTNFEEETMAKYLGISLEEAKKLYDGTILTPSFYQFGISMVTEKFQNTPFKKEIEKWRSTGDRGALESINATFAKANFYEKRDLLYKRDESIEPDAEGNIIVQRNKIFNNKNLKPRTAEILKSLEDVFFEDPTEMTPMDMLDNILMQYYNVGLYKYSIEIERYADFLKVMGTEGASYIYQAKDIREQEMGIEKHSKNEQEQK